MIQNIDFDVTAHDLRKNYAFSYFPCYIFESLFSQLNLLDETVDGIGIEIVQLLSAIREEFQIVSFICSLH